MRGWYYRLGRWVRRWGRSEGGGRLLRDRVLDLQILLAFLFLLELLLSLLFRLGWVLRGRGCGGLLVPPNKADYWVLERRFHLQGQSNLRVD